MCIDEWNAIEVVLQQILIGCEIMVGLPAGFQSGIVNIILIPSRHNTAADSLNVRLHALKHPWAPRVETMTLCQIPIARKFFFPLHLDSTQAFSRQVTITLKLPERNC
jgi:hypothetical protein